MAILEPIAHSISILGTALFAFVIGMFAWGAISGFVAGVLSGFGIALSAPDLIMLGPVAGGAAAIGTVMVVFG